MKILGLSAFYHDSAAALIEDGKIIAAVQEERLTRKKHDSSFPRKAIASCLEIAQIKISDVDHIVFYDKPFLKFERLLETYLAFVPRGLTSFSKAMPIWLREKLFQKNLIFKELREIDPDVDWFDRLLFSEHHLSHAASAYYPSPFDEALVLTMDGVGEWATTSVAIGKGHSLDIIKEIHFPHSLGLLYAAFTYYLGFKVNSGEYKVMGLAPYGQPKYVQTILDHLIDVKSDGSFRLNLEYFDFCTGLKMTNRKFANLFGGPERKPEENLTDRHMDVAASIQMALEEVVMKLARSLAAETGASNLCLAGGVALNCVANGKILRDGKFKKLWIQPAAGDAGGALGAALAAYHLHLGNPRTVSRAHDGMQGSFLGPQFSNDEVHRRLTALGAKFQALSDHDLLEATTNALLDGKAVGWFQGAMEFGPRALGGRSILADARSSKMQATLNLKVKHRESFRPFAPSVLREDVAQWFELDEDSPYMLLVADVRESKRLPVAPQEQKLSGLERLKALRSEIPAVTHVDYSARVQTVHAETNPRYHELLKRFKQKTGCPVLVNTSFNVRGEPIVGSPEDAFRCFMGTEIDVLVVGNCFLNKNEQAPDLKLNYKDKFDLD